MLLFALVAYQTMLPVPPPRPDPKPAVFEDTKQVEIAGWPYRVRRLSADTAEITGGDPAAPRNTAILDRFRVAAERTTGCALKKPSFFDGGVRGELDCSGQRIP